MNWDDKNIIFIDIVSKGIMSQSLQFKNIFIKDGMLISFEDLIHTFGLSMKILGTYKPVLYPKEYMYEPIIVGEKFGTPILEVMKHKYPNINWKLIEKNKERYVQGESNENNKIIYFENVKNIHLTYDDYKILDKFLIDHQNLIEFDKAFNIKEI